MKLDADCIREQESKDNHVRIYTEVCNVVAMVVDTVPENTLGEKITEYFYTDKDGTVKLHGTVGLVEDIK